MRFRVRSCFAERRWFSGKISRCHRDAPGSIPGRRTTFAFLPFAPATPTAFSCAHCGSNAPPPIITRAVPYRAQTRLSPTVRSTRFAPAAVSSADHWTRQSGPSRYPGRHQHSGLVPGVRHRSTTKARKTLQWATKVHRVVIYLGRVFEQRTNAALSFGGQIGGSVFVEPRDG